MSQHLHHKGNWLADDYKRSNLQHHTVNIINIDQ